MDEGKFGSLQSDHVLSDDQGEVALKSGLLGRRVLGRRNSLITERSRTVSAKKSSPPPEPSSLNMTLAASSGNKQRLSFYDLPKTSSATALLMPPPRAPLGWCFLLNKSNPWFGRLLLPYLCLDYPDESMAHSGYVRRVLYVQVCHWFIYRVLGCTQLYTRRRYRSWLG